jgi:hypothetical protein
VSTKDSQFGVLKNRVGDTWNVDLIDGSTARFSTSEVSSLVIKRADEIVWGDSCQYCGLEIDPDTHILPNLSLHDIVGNSNCPHKFHLACLADKFGAFLDRGAKRKCLTCGVGWKVGWLHKITLSKTHWPRTQRQFK